MMAFYFADQVVVEENLIGCIVKSWGGSERRPPHYEVYVRSYNAIKEYNESDIQRYIVSKELSEEEKQWH
jgi:hypothetical protein